MINVDAKHVHGQEDGLTTDLLGHLDDWNVQDTVDAVLFLEVLRNCDALAPVLRIREGGLVGILVDKLLNCPLGLSALDVEGGDADTLETTKILLHLVVVPILLGLFEALLEFYQLSVAFINGNGGGSILRGGLQLKT